MGRWGAVLLAVAGAGCGPVEERPEPWRQARRDAVYAGAYTAGHPSVMAVLVDAPDGTGIGLCSSTLVGPRLLLTAAHCVEGGINHRASTAPDLSAAGVEFIPSVRAVALPAWLAGGLDPAQDLGVVELAREPFAPVVPPNDLPLEAIPADQRSADLVGYGDTNAVAANYGVRRAVRLHFGPVYPDDVKYGNVNGNSCFGDSGGPLLLASTGKVAAVASMGWYPCGRLPSRATRVDSHLDFLGAQLALAAGSCAADGRCVQGCTPVDPDCACVEDGACNPACSAPSIDPDCPSACAADGVCAVGCVTADPDCSTLGGPCGRDAHCPGRQCVSDAQHPVPYCSQACDGARPCPAGFDCAGGQCLRPQLPVAGEGQPCTPGQTFCGGPDRVCASGLDGGAPTCRRRCLEDADCGGGSCTVAFGDHREGVCQPPPPPPPTQQGCATVPGELPAGAALLALALARRRRRA